jgi:hypothetical protein
MLTLHLSKQIYPDKDTPVHKHNTIMGMGVLTVEINIQALISELDGYEWSASRSASFTAGGSEISLPPVVRSEVSHFTRSIHN